LTDLKIQELIQLGIRIQVGILTTFASIIAASISLIPSLLLGGVYKVLLRLSTFGVIVSALEAALKATGCGLTLEVVVNQSRSLILGLTCTNSTGNITLSFLFFDRLLPTYHPCITTAKRHSSG